MDEPLEPCRHICARCGKCPECCEGHEVDETTKSMRWHQLERVAWNTVAYGLLTTIIFDLSWIPQHHGHYPSWYVSLSVFMVASVIFSIVTRKRKGSK